jgi:hypothetical protein
MKYIGFFCLFFTLLSCSEGRYTVPGKPVHPISINRFDRTFYQTGGSPDSLFLELYTNQIMGVGEPMSPLFMQFDSIFRSDRQIGQIYSDCQLVFKDVSSLESKLTRAFYRLHYFFPSIPYPNVYMHISDFGESVVSAPGMLSADIDKYLGPNYPLYRGKFLNYQTQRMYPEKILSDYLAGWVRSEFTEESLLDQQRLLDYMVYEGKILFFLKVVLPDESMENISGFTKGQLEWCKRNEKGMWNSILNLHNLYNSDAQVISRYLGEAQNTSFFPKDAPGRAAVWLGYRMVVSFMKRHHRTSVQDLLLKTSSQSLLSGSLYNP